MAQFRDRSRRGRKERETLGEVEVKEKIAWNRKGKEMAELASKFEGRNEENCCPC